MTLPDLPISAVLPALSAALSAGPRAVLAAPPGAGKTTLVPLHLLQAPWCTGRIILLEPRRLAARAAATRMASLLGEEPGETVGYRMRLETRVSRKTRIEVVTEGVFARMVLDDPGLEGISAVLFDEFHERSLDADLGLALALDVQAGLRDDLRLVVMSATLDTARIAALLDNAPVIVSEGRSFPVTIRHQDRPPGERIEDSMARAIRLALAEDTGSILAFLPGQAEIRRTAERLDGKLDAATDLVPLYGNLTLAEQNKAIRPPAPGRRKVVLATSIAETSITIDGVTVVIDSGLQRLPVFEPQTGVTRLETQRASRASADQRAGRAGRTAPGTAIRLWHAGQTAAMPAFTPPQILASDLSGLVLTLADWGVTDPATLRFLDPPPAPACAEARALLVALGALTPDGLLTAEGRQIRNLALPPRLAAMVVEAGRRGEARMAAELAVLLTEQGLGGPGIDLEDRLRRFRSDRSERAEKARGLARGLAGGVDRGPRSGDATPGQLLLHAFPDRIASARGGRGRYVLANGRGAMVEETERLAGAPMLVVADLTGQASEARILAAAEISRTQVETELADRLVTEDVYQFDRQARQVRARRLTRLGGIVFDDKPVPKPDPERQTRALAEGIRQIGLDCLPFSREAQHLRSRIGFLHRSLGEPWPDMSDAALLASLEDWFLPYQAGARAIADVDPGLLSEGLQALVPDGLRRDLDRMAPTHFTAPTGQRHPIRYDGDEPVLQIRVQELFGLTTHPTVGGGRLPLVLELTSPAHRPIQTTRDLPRFWAGSWKDVRADMRGRYPKHPWPEDPAHAMPTTRAKPRGT